MLLTIALIALFSVATVSVALSLVDSAMRARNAYPELARAAAATHRVMPEAYSIKYVEVSALPQLRCHNSRGNAAPRLSKRDRRTRVSAVA